MNSRMCDKMHSAVSKSHDEFQDLRIYVIYTAISTVLELFNLAGIF